MDFFNKKEDVFEIVLTEKGRRSLVHGDFKLKYYSFHDTDIVYDPAYLNLTMSSNSQVDRIQNDQQTLKSNIATKGVDQQVNKRGKIIKEVEVYHSFLGSSELESQYYPAFNIFCLKSQFTGSYSYENIGYTCLRTPVLEIVVNNEFDYFDKYWKIDDYILLSVNELNGVSQKYNFDLEIYQVERRVGVQDKFYQLLFKKELKEDESISQNVEESTRENPEVLDVEYFFNITVDHFIVDSIEFMSLPPNRQQELRDLLYGEGNQATIC